MEILTKTLGIFMALFLGSIFLPIAIETFVGVDTTNWSDQLVMVWNNIPIIGLAGFLIAIIAYAVVAIKNL